MECHTRTQTSIFTLKRYSLVRIRSNTQSAIFNSISHSNTELFLTVDPKFFGIKHYFEGYFG